MSDVPDPESGTVHDAPNQQVVRPAMMQHVTHRDQAPFIDLFAGIWRECDAVDAAHRHLCRPIGGGDHVKETLNRRLFVDFCCL